MIRDDIGSVFEEKPDTRHSLRSAFTAGARQDPAHYDVAAPEELLGDANRSQGGVRQQSPGGGDVGSHDLPRPRPGPHPGDEGDSNDITRGDVPCRKGQ